MRIAVLFVLLIILCSCGKQNIIDDNNSITSSVTNTEQAEKSLNNLLSLSASDVKDIEIVHFISDDNQNPVSKLIDSPLEINGVLDIYKEIEISEQINLQESTGGREFLVKINLNSEKTVAVSRYSDTIIEIDGKYYKAKSSLYSEKLEAFYNNLTEEEKPYFN